MNTDRENKVLEKIQSLSPEVAQIRLTETMVNKYIIDAKADTQRLAALFGFTFEDCAPGEGQTFEAVWWDGTPATVKLYRAKTRGDKRVSITGLRKKAQPGDLIALSYKRGADGQNVLTMHVSNVTVISEVGFPVSYRVKGAS